MLKNYEIDPKDFSENIQKIICLENQGYEENIDYHTNSCNHLTVQSVIENPADILILKNFRIMSQNMDFTFKDHLALANALSGNLIKNSRAVRLETLQIL